MQYSNTHLTKIFSSTAITKKIIPPAAQQKLGIKSADDAKKFFYGKTSTQANDVLKRHGVDAKFRSIITGHLDGHAVGGAGGKGGLLDKYSSPTGKAKLDDMLSRSAKDKRVFMYFNKKLPQGEQEEFRELVLKKQKTTQRILKSGMKDRARDVQNAIAMGIEDEGVGQHDLAGITKEGRPVGGDPAGINSDAGRQSNASSIKTENTASISAVMSKKSNKEDSKSKKKHKSSMLQSLSI